jgi:hypothetical protein
LISKVGNKTKIVDMFAKRLWFMRARLFAWAELETEYSKKEHCRQVMIRLSYRPSETYHPGDIRDFLKKIKQHLGKNLLAFAWVAELQRRGEIHYHLLLIVRKGTRIKKPDESGMWSHGSTRIETARSLFYICAYVGKEYQKDLAKFPRSCRLYGASVRSDKGTAEAFRVLSGLKRSKDTGESEWAFVGATVTKDYAGVILDSAVKSREPGV